MSAFDLPIEQLRAYLPAREEPEDFDAFWRATLEMSRAAAAPPRFERIETALRTVTVDDVTFGGFAGQPIRAWLLAPAGASEPLPTVVEYIGYGGGRSLPFEWLQWASAGYAHFVMDTRGQGSVWSPGDTPDVEDGSTGGHHPGFVTRGIERPETWYYRRLVTDAVLAVDAARSHPLVDGSRIAVAGMSQGGGLALAVAALGEGVGAATIDVPFLCSWRRALEITDAHPYRELTQYLSIHRDLEAAVLRTTAYVDGVNFAPRATAPALFSVGLMDEICPPSTVFAAYNHYAGPKDVRVWSFNGHEAGELFHQSARYEFLASLGLAP
ncbi:MAG TPA: acetylxylan esterase [Candidatus Limnocylindrales bacterium]|nr:acetylxylan esterase [Candidatus Limnocylindrales bacterium]